MEINADELLEVREPNELEGILKGPFEVMWRRAVRREHLSSYKEFEGNSDDAPSDAWNYVSIYRWATDEEVVEYDLEGDTLLVVSIVSSAYLARFIDPAVDAD
jgi:hypothetical protein